MGEMQEVMEGACTASPGIPLREKVCECGAQEGAAERLTRPN